MLFVITYCNNYNLYDLGFLKNSNDTILVTPNPNIADYLRESVVKKNIEVVTIAHFIKQVFNEEDKKRFFNKSDYYLFLSIVWKRLKKNLNHNEFDNVFNNFTELRSYTLNWELLSDIFTEDELPNKDVIEKFWKISDSFNIIDEQKSYQLFIEQNLEKLKNKNIVFWGFKFFSGLQLDLIKNISELCDIYIPIPKQIFEDDKQKIDWPQWLLLDKTVVDINDETISNKQNSLIKYQKNRLSDFLRIVRQDKDENELFICTDELSLINTLDLPWNNLNFKTNINIFSEEIEEVFSGNLEMDLEKMVTLALSTKNYKKLKIISLLSDLMKKWKEYGEETFCEFDFKILRFCLELNLPRNYIIPVSALELKSIKTINEFGFNAKNTNKVIIFPANIKSSGISLTDIQKKIVAIAPIRNPKLDFKYLKHSIMDMLSSGKNKIFIPDDFLEKDSKWDELLGSIPVQEVLNQNKKKNEIINLLLVNEKTIKKNKKKISYSYLQAYIDCPRKFYYQYIEKLDLNLDLKEELNARELGILEHQIIGSYINNYKEYKIKFHELVVDQVLNNHISFQQKRLGVAQTKISKFELISRTRNVLFFLLKLNLKCQFEVEIKNDHATGFIDVLFLNGFFDFKRSLASVPSKKEILELNNIQIPFYLSQLKQKISIVGFLNLNDLSKSLVFIDGEIDQQLIETLSEHNITPNILKLEELINNYRTLENELLSTIEQDKEFNANPRSADICRFCQLKEVCNDRLR